MLTPVPSIATFKRGPSPEEQWKLTNPGRGGCPNDPRGMPGQVRASFFPRNGKPQSFIQGFPLHGLDVSRKSQNPSRREQTRLRNVADSRASNIVRSVFPRTHNNVALGSDNGTSIILCCRAVAASLRGLYFLKAEPLLELIVRLTVDLDIRVDEVIERWTILLWRQFDVAAG